MNLEEAKTFVESNKVVLTEENKIARCVDGRYENITNFPMIAKPGGDTGDILAVFGALNILGKELENEKVFELVINNIGGLTKFNFHSDDHADPNVPGLGCGHIKQAKLDPSAYGVTQEQIDYIFDQLPELITQGAHQEILHGDHAEQAVIVVDSVTYGVMPLHRGDERSLEEAFIYQKTIHQNQLDELSRKVYSLLQESGDTVTEPQVMEATNEAFGKQLGETLNRLAKDLPVFVATIDDLGSVNISQ